MHQSGSWREFSQLSPIRPFVLCRDRQTGEDYRKSVAIAFIEALSRLRTSLRQQFAATLASCIKFAGPRIHALTVNMEAPRPRAILSTGHAPHEFHALMNRFRLSSTQSVAGLSQWHNGCVQGGGQCHACRVPASGGTMQGYTGGVEACLSTACRCLGV